MTRPTRGNRPNHFVGEWFGQRLFPVVQLGEQSLQVLRESTCPFLSEAKGERTDCIKLKPSLGVCTITSREGALYGRQGGSIDWLVCPYRTLHHGLLEEVARRLFGIEGDTEVLILAGITLRDDEIRAAVRNALVGGQRVFAYFRAQLGGEISLNPTDRSPEFAFDITLVEIEPGDHPVIGRYAIVEVQTMEFHGSYAQATAALRNALDLHGDDFGDQIGANPEWAARGIQGPSIADTFKRTFYQMMFKFQLGMHERCAGTVLALPASVWNSWQRHLGGPTLVQDSEDAALYRLPKPEGVSLTESVTATVLVFDTDLDHGLSPNPLRVDKVIQTDTPTLLHYAFDVAPEAALGAGATDRLYGDICSRVLFWWPELVRLVT